MNIFLHYILPPLVGAAIGYITNWIAVKMLFRPLYPKYLGKWRLPFTPGIIPRRKDALAKAIGKAVGEELLTKEDIQKAFCGEEKRAAAVTKLTDGVMSAAEKTIRALAESAVSLQTFEEKKAELAENVSEKVALALPEMRIGDTIAEVAGNAVLEKIKSSPLGMFVGEGTVRSVAQSMSGRIDEYLALHGKEKLLPAVKKEIDSLAEAPIENLLQGVGVGRESVEKAIGTLYDKALLPAIGEAAASFDIPSEVEKKIGMMDVKELEKLCLSVMKKELNAITWLGGLIGLILGVVNIFL